MTELAVAITYGALGGIVGTAAIWMLGWLVGSLLDARDAKHSAVAAAELDATLSGILDRQRAQIDAAGEHLRQLERELGAIRS